MNTLQLASALEVSDKHPELINVSNRAAAELRRLHLDNEAKDKELETLREYAAGRACTQAVIDALGPMSLWSKSGFEAEIRKAVEAEREACAKLCEEGGKDESGRIHVQAWGCAKAIRARGELK